VPYALRPIGNVTGIEIYRSDVVVKREGYAPAVKDRTRAPIREFSKKSRQRLAFTAANTDVVFRSMITLTYPRDFPSDGRLVKRHLNRFLQWFKRDSGGVSLLWFLEFQRRGAPHVHILSDRMVPRGVEDRRGLRFRVSASWYRIVDSGDIRHHAAGTRTERLRSLEGGRRYAVKYAMKMKQKVVPEAYQNVGRFWGCTRDVPPKPLDVIRCTEDDIRGILENYSEYYREDKPLSRVLYNVGSLFDAYRSGELDNGANKVYNRHEGDSENRTKREVI